MTPGVGHDHPLDTSSRSTPHPEGLADPLSYADHVSALPDEQIAMVMGGTLARLMRIGT